MNSVATQTEDVKVSCRYCVPLIKPQVRCKTCGIVSGNPKACEEHRRFAHPTPAEKVDQEVAGRSLVWGRCHQPPVRCGLCGEIVCASYHKEHHRKVHGHVARPKPQVKVSPRYPLPVETPSASWEERCWQTVHPNTEWPGLGPR